MNKKFSPYVKKIRINENIYVLNHSLLIEQIFFQDSNILKDEDFKNFLASSDSDKKLKNKIVKGWNDRNTEYSLLRILLTDLCNLDCKYCKVRNNTIEESTEATPLKDVYRALSLLFAKREQNKVIHITGGEPLVFFESAKRIINYIIKNYSKLKYKYIIVVGTNGVLLDKDQVEFFKENNIKVIVSLDGNKSSNKLRVFGDGKSSYESTIKALDILKAEEVEFGISMVVGSHNIKNIKKDIRFIEREFEPSSIGINFIKNTNKNKISPYLISGKKYANSIYDIFLENREKGVFLELLIRKIYPFVYQDYRLYDCGASSGTTINIDASGKIGTCKSFLCLREVYAENEITEIINKFKKRSPLYNQHCLSCIAQGICGNGCAYEANTVGSDGFIDKRACEYVLQFYHRFLIDLFNVNRDRIMAGIKKDGYCILSRDDRKKILAKIKKDPMSLKQCIGHEF